MTLALLIQQAAQAIAAAPTPADQTEVVPYMTTAAGIYFTQKWLKTRPAYAEFVQALPGAAKWAHRAVAMIGSVIAAVGIHFTYTGTLQAGGTLQFLIPSLWDMAHAVSDVGKVFLLQQWGYEMAKPKQWTPFPPVQPSVVTTSTAKQP